MAEYKISQVSQNPPVQKSFQDRNTGQMVIYEIYKVMLEDVDETVDLNRKVGSRPNVGDVLYGTLDHTGFGLKFKKADRAASAPPQNKQKPTEGDKARDMAMYTSYAKDLAIAILETSPANEPFNKIKFQEVYKEVGTGAEYLNQHADLGIAFMKDTE